MNKIACGLQSAVEKNRARHRFENIGEQSMLAPATALLLTTTKAHELAEPKFIRSLGQRWRAHQSMLHARQLSFAGVRIGPEKIVSHDQTENGIAEELERFVVQIARPRPGARRDLLVRPRTMRH